MSNGLITIVLAARSPQPVPIQIPPVATIARDAFPAGETKLMIAALVLEIHELQGRLARLEESAGLGGMLIT